MAKKLEFWGALGTAIYLAIIGVTVANKFDDFLCLELNELGDFLAGVFGPIAFLWLVLGFLQQGRELKLSSASLRIQAIELTKAVEQYKELVDVNRRQFDAESEYRKQALLLRMKEVRPIFVAEWYSSNHGADAHKVFFHVKNIGGNVTKVKFTHADQLDTEANSVRFMGRGDAVLFNLQFNGSGAGISGVLEIDYCDVDHSQGAAKIKYEVRPPSGPEEQPTVHFESDEV
ncbi:hypothetical protein [Pseudomonas sp. BF-B-25]|uniref:hypothetical protein n=1 Tax=Pseudomonas sp. BF-B-25 TaxID=2832355 RepID=UPI001CBAA20B|nr:hypothetical protein [Pseudomonas sp. BF-B-25]